MPGVLYYVVRRTSKKEVVMYDFCVVCWKIVHVPAEYSRRYGTVYCSNKCHADEQYFRAYYSDKHYVSIRR